ncbi:unnamed protein product [Cyprideis torosa]|uniref:Uncharacterized protein n=1 Tax=Cyprideis torosa TaxID=163714 RepID=A0A7R8WT03_9CRUS|nr:unnamed protein product [Cyprideis torosa]CAG0905258.1 unnamed protein product [Cyprideis torosa]
MQGSQLTAKGTIVPEQEHELRAKIEGYLEGFNKRAGDRVDTNELLGRIKLNVSSEYALQMTQLESSVQKQKVERKIAVENHRRLKEGFQQGVVPGNDVLEARQKLELADAGLNSVTRELDSVRRLSKERETIAERNSSLKSLSAGVMTEKLASNGEWIEKGRLLGKIVSVDRLKIQAFLLPDDALKLQPGDAVTVTTPEQEQSWQEKVLQISPIINKTQENNHLQEVVISNQHAPYSPRVNTKVDLAFTSGVPRNALTLPLDALFKRAGDYQILQIDEDRRPGFGDIMAARGFWSSLQYLACTIAPCHSEFVQLQARQVVTGDSNLDRLQNIFKTYTSQAGEVPVLKDISFNIKRGEYVCIRGASGSGKSTLLNILGCLDNPTSGHYTISGKPLQKADEALKTRMRRQHIGFVFQRFHLIPTYTAVRNVELPLIYASTPKHQRLARAEEALEKMGLSDRLHHMPNQLSGGQQQRVAIARGIVNQPDILIADEPTGALDEASSDQIMSIFDHLNASGVTVVLVTHDDNVAQHARRIITLRSGKLVENT